MFKQHNCLTVRSAEQLKIIAMHKGNARRDNFKQGCVHESQENMTIAVFSRPLFVNLQIYENYT